MNLKCDDLILSELFANKDEKYRIFHSRLIPNVPPDSILGVRVPKLRAIARRFVGSPAAQSWCAKKRHDYYEGYALHALFINEMKSFDEAVRKIADFLPMVDNWAVCDMLAPAAFKKSSGALCDFACSCLNSEREYTIRFGIRMLMDHFIKSGFSPELASCVASIDDDRYYVKMAIAWYFATALSFRFDETLPFIAERRLTPWCHAKAIQKSIESFRITPTQKVLLKRLR